MRTKILLACIVALSLISAVNAVSLSVSIGTYDTTIAKNAQVTVPVTVTISGMQGGTSTVSVTITPKSGLSCTTCTNTLSFSSDSSKSTSFVLKADAAGNYDAPFTITATTSGASATPQTGSSSIVVTEAALVYNLILYNTSVPVLNTTDSKYYVPLVMEFTTGSVALENVTIKLDLGSAPGAVSSGSVSYYFSSLPANSPVKVSWIARIDHFSVYGISGSITSNNYYSSVGNSLSGPGAGDGGGTGAPAAGGGGGGSVPALIEGLQSFSLGIMDAVVKELGLKFKFFYSVSNALASVLALVSDVTGEWPAPNLDISSIVARPVTTLEGDIYELAVQRAKKKWISAPTVVIARGDLGVDSMSAIAFAKARNYPILLTKPKELPSVVQAQVKTWGPSSIIIAGGPVAVSKEVEAALSAIAPVERIQGRNREETAIKLAEALEKSKIIETIVVADGLSAAPEATIIAAGYYAPIVYVAGDAVPQVTKDFLAGHKMTKGIPKKMKVVFVGVSGKAQSDIEAAMK